MINKTTKRTTTYTLSNWLWIYTKLLQLKKRKQTKEIRGRSAIINACINYCRNNNIDLKEHL